MMERTTLLIDGDIICYQAAAAAEQPIQWTDDLWTLHADFREGKRYLEEKIEEISDMVSHTAMGFAISPDFNFRYQLWPLYKANRKGKRRPMILPQLKQYLKDSYPTWLRPNIEADDVLGILSTSSTLLEGKKIIVSIDKDFNGVPGFFCNTKDWEIKEISTDAADRFHMYQTLIGDTADGYPGCPGVGPVAATKLLDGLTGYAEMWPKVVKAYEKKHLSEEYAQTMAQLARICRAEDYDFQKNEVLLWNATEHCCLA